jgi:rhodanese-related sulfurtransferase
MIPKATGPRLGLLALVLGAVALFSEPHRGPFVKLDAQELGLIVQQETDHVTPTELAGWIIEGRSDYRLLDLRSPDEFATYHIPGAENVPPSQLSDYPLLPTEKIVVYSGGGIHAAQGWMLLRALGFRGVYTVLGGLDGWTDEVLYPSPPAGNDVQAAARFQQAAAVATFFGGQPRIAAGETPPAQPALPKLAPPVAGPAVPVAPRGKKREGC